VGLATFAQRTITFTQQVRGEMRKVSWPTWDDLRRSTMVITVFVVIIGIIIGVMDSVFSLILIKWLGQIFG
jgi:preprotein translocase subunit SecE